MSDYVISGLQPALTGGEWDYGTSWFLFDESGTFSIDKDISARIYLVGGGFDGAGGKYELNLATAGQGGNGGCVKTLENVNISKNTECFVDIASANENADENGRTLIQIGTSGIVYHCNDVGCTATTGGSGARVSARNIPQDGIHYSSANAGVGQDGVLTPYGWVGSSGGGGSARFSKEGKLGAGGKGAGQGGFADSSAGKASNAQNYGCGGGGGGARLMDFNSLSKGLGFKGGTGKGGCVIVCVLDDTIVNETPLDLTYNGKQQYPFGISDITGVEFTGDTSAILAGKYTVHVKITAPELTWADGTRGEKDIDWEIKPLALKKPDVWIETTDDNGSAIQTKYEVGKDFSFPYSGYAPSHSECWKIPIVEENYSDVGKYADVLNISGNGITRQYAYDPNGYSITFSIKHPLSCYWIDEDEETQYDDYVVNWSIARLAVDIPTKAAEEDFTYDNKQFFTSVAYPNAVPERTVQISGFVGKLMGYGKDYNAFNAGNYTLNISLLDTKSSYWNDDEQSISTKTINWTIKKQKRYYDIPYLEDDQKEFLYDATTHTPVITNRNNSVMSFEGTISAVAANTDKKPQNVIEIELKTESNYENLWKIGDDVVDEDERYELERQIITLYWKITPHGLNVPAVSKKHRPFNGQQQYETPTSALGYDSKYMNYSGTTYATKASPDDGYGITYRLRDKESAYWILPDGTTSTDDWIAKWWIDKIEVHIPAVADTDLAVKWRVHNYTVYADNQSPTVEPFDSYIIRKSDDTSASMPRGKDNPYVLKLSLADPDSSYWENGTTDDKEFPWTISKHKVYIEKPYLTVDPCEYTYDGTEKILDVSGLAEYHTRLNDYGYYRTYIEDRADSDTVTRYLINDIVRYKFYTDRGTQAGEYETTYELVQSDILDYVWEDDTTDNVVLQWKVNIGTFPKPDLKNKTFKFTNSRITVDEINYNGLVMSRVSGSTLYATQAGTYTITYSLIDKNSAAWDDGTTDDVVIEWQIIALTGDEYAVPIPEVADLEFVYDGNYKIPTIGDYDTALVGVTGYTRQRNAGEYSFKFYLKSPNSSAWTDSTIEDKTITWKIVKNTITVPKPTMKEGTNSFVYDGKEHFPDIVGYTSTYMTREGGKNRAAGNYTVTYTLKTNSNTTYLWEDDTSAPVSFEWSISKIQRTVPYIDDDTFDYGGYTYSVYYTSHAWRQPELFGYESDVMSSTGVTQYKASISNEYYHGVSTTYYKDRYFGNYQWAVGKYYIEITSKYGDSIEWLDENGTPLDINKIVIEWTIQKKVLLLKKPYLNAENQSFEYTGETIEPQIENFDTVLVIDGDRSAEKAGNYEIAFELDRRTGDKPIYDYRWEDNTTDPVTLNWEITKGTAKIPIVTNLSFVYDGENHYPDISNLEVNASGNPVKFTVSGSSQRRAGKYNITFALKDASSCSWENGTTAPIVVEWEILPAAFKKPTISPTALQYDYKIHKVEFADVIDEENEQYGKSIIISGYNGDVMTGGSSYERKDVGKYSVTIRLKDSGSSTWADGTTDDVVLEWEITKLTILLDKPYLDITEYEFDATTHQPTVINWKTGMHYKSGSVTSARNAGKYTITIQLDTDRNITYLWGDAIENAVEGDIVLEWEIIKLILKKPTVSPLKWTYDGNLYEPNINLFDSTYESTSGTLRATNAGEYSITISLRYPTSTEWDDGSTESLNFPWVIERVSVGIDGRPYLEPTSYTFDAQYHLPNVIDYNEDTMDKSGYSSKRDAGTYKITVKPDQNHCWADGTTDDVVLEWEIAKLVLKKPCLEQDTFTYDTSTQHPNVIDYDSTYMSKSGDWSGRTAGNYNGIISLRYPTSTEWDDGSTESLNFPWAILPIIAKKPKASPLKWQYDGKEHAPAITPISQLGVNVTGTFRSTNAGKFKITFSLMDKSTKSVSWEDGTYDDITFEWEITKVPVTKPRLIRNRFVYSGGEHRPVIVGINDDLMILAGTRYAVEYGNYHIYARLKDPTNYCWTDGSSADLDMIWRIGKTPVLRPTIDPVMYEYTGASINAVINGFRTGIMKYVNNTVASATAIGEYNIYIQLNSNYEWEDGGWNDTSLNEIVHLTWEIVTAVIKTPVVTRLEFTYDGSLHAPTISDYNTSAVITSGVLSAINANENGYTIRFSLKEKENTVWDIGGNDDIVYTWYIHQAVLPKPYAEASEFVYNGGWQSPILHNINEELMRFTGTNKEINAGIYSYTIYLKNTTNYRYDDGTNDPINIIWSIGRKPIDEPYLVPNTFVYDSTTHSPTIYGFDSSIMTIASGSATSRWDVGAYQITIILGQYKNGGYVRNWEWRNSKSYGSLALNWEITKRPLPYPTIYPDTYDYTGSYISPIMYDYNSQLMKCNGDTQAIKVGDYFISFSIVDTRRYMWRDDTNAGAIPWHIVPAHLDPADLPKQYPIAVYNGKEQTPTWDNKYSALKYILTVESQRDVGKYTAAFEPTEGFIWADGTRTPREVPWEIIKLGIPVPQQLSPPQ